MADEEPESQIVPFYHYDDDPLVPSSPSIPTFMALQNASIGNAKSPIGDGNLESQLGTRQTESCKSRVEDTQFESIEEDTELPDSNISRVEETQFVPVEIDTQAVDDANFPSTQRDSQFQKPVTGQSSLVTSSIAAPLLSRPDAGNIDDIASGFTFGAFQKPFKGMFNRPAPNALNSQREIEGPSNEGQLISLPTHVAKGTRDRNPIDSALEPPLPAIPAATAVEPFVSTNLTPVVADKLSLVNGIVDSNSTAGLSFSQKLATTAVHPDESLRVTLMGRPPLIESMVEPNIRTSNYKDANHVQEPLQQDARSVSVTTHDPQTPIREASQGILGQKSSNKGHKRVKKKFGTPFPDVLDPPSNQRWHGTMRMTNIPRLASPLSHAQHKHATTSTVAQANAGLSRPFNSNMDVGVNIVNCRHHSVPSPELSPRDVPAPSGRPTESVAREEQIMHMQNDSRASAPLHHARSARNSNEDTNSRKSAHTSESNTSELQLGNAVQQFCDQLQRSEPPHENSGALSDPSAQAELAEPTKSLENDNQNEVSKQIVPEMQPTGLGSPHITNSQAAGVVEVVNPQSISITNHGTSRAPSDVPSRPQSRRSNCGNKITRPLTAQDLCPQGLVESAAQREIHSTKIKKSGNAPSNPIPSEASVKSAVPPSGQQRGNSGSRPKFFQQYKAFLTNGQQILEIIEDYEQQSQKIEAQNTEIKKLRDASDSAINQVRALESEKAGLTEKLKKCVELGSKYRKHMNDVIVSQKYLKSQAQEIQKSTKDAIESTRLAVENHATLSKIEKAVEKAKDIRVSQEEFERATKQNQDLAAANQELAATTEELRDETNKLQKGAQELRDEAQKLRNNNEQLTIDKKQLQINLGAATKNCELLETTLNRRLMELAQEKYQVEQLERTRADPQDSYKMLAELLGKTPKHVANELTKEDGLLAKIWDLEKTTQEKVGEAVILSTTFQNQGADASASLNKIIEDLFLRFETSVQASNNDAAAQQQSHLKLLDDFKATVNKLSLDKENEIQLKNRIMELGRSNDTLVIEKNARGRETQGLANQLDELKRDLAGCRVELKAKNDELTAILATPKEDPRLRAQIQDLETARNTVHGQLESANRELVKVRGEVKSVQELARRKDQQMKDWEKKHNDAQARVKILQEEKNKFLASKQQEIEKACAEERERIAKAGESAKATMKMKLESEVKHLEEKVKEKESELATAQEDFQRAQDERGVSMNQTEKLQGEVLDYKEQFKRQVAHLKRLEDLNPGREASDRLTDDLRSLRNECTELRNHLESIRSENSQNIEAILRGQQAIETSLRQIDSLENENEELKQTNARLLQRAERLNEAHKQEKTRQAGHHDSQRAVGGPKNIAFTTSGGVLPPSQQNERVLGGHRVETPEGALRKATREVRSFISGSHVESVARGSSLKFANDFETPLGRNQGVLREGSTKFNTPNATTGVNDDTSSASHPHYTRSTTRKVADRKAGSLVRKAGETCTPDFQLANTGNHTSKSANNTLTQDLSGITPFAALASSFPTPSPCTDLSSMIDELGSAPDQEQLQKGYAKARGKKEGDASTNIAGIGGLHTFAKATMQSLKEDEGGRDAVNKSQRHGNPISAEEEAQRRRTAQPRKPSLKKTKPMDEPVPRSEPRPVATRVEDVVHTGNKVVFQVQNGPRGFYNRAVSGSKPQTPKDSNPFTTDEAILRPSITEHQSPNMAPCKRNKRTASTTTHTQVPPKRIRTSQGSSLGGRLEVADSQDQLTF